MTTFNVFAPEHSIDGTRCIDASHGLDGSGGPSTLTLVAPRSTYQVGAAGALAGSCGVSASSFMPVSLDDIAALRNAVRPDPR